MEFEQQLQQIFKSSTDSESAVVARITEAFNRRQRMHTRLRLSYYGTGLLISGALFMYFIDAAVAGMQDSGFIDLTRLLISDFSVVSAQWNNFVYSLAESIPIFSVTGAFIALFGIILTAANSAQAWFTTRIQTITQT